MIDEVAALLRGIRNQQRVQIERQAGALALQREQFGRYRQPFDLDRIQDRADSIQRRAGWVAKVVAWIAVPLLLGLLLLMPWTYLRHLPA